jgi:hypothetical protein
MKRIYLPVMAVESLERRSSVNVHITPVYDESTGHVREYISAKDVQPLIDALEEAVKWSEFPDLKARWARVINAFDAKTFR